MGQRSSHRRVNDGYYTGLKQDRFRNSEFETETGTSDRFAGVSRANANTINGPWAENRGRRGDQIRLDNPFETGELSNWHNRQGWDDVYLQGNGPRGYVRSDQRIFEDVCEALTRDAAVDASEVEVKVETGVVTLSGTIADRPMKKRAGHVTELISGVRDVQNLLELSA